MDDLIAEFITETNESLTQLDTEIVNLEQNPDDEDLIKGIFRLMHTIKGTCGFLGLGRLEKVAHAGENVLDKLRNKELPVSSEAVSLILASLDRIKELLAVLEETGAEPEGDDTDLRNKLNAFAEGKFTAPPPPKPIEIAAQTSNNDIFNEDDFVVVPANMTAQPEPEAPKEKPKSAPKINSKSKEVAVKEGLKAKKEEPQNNAAAAANSAGNIRVNIDTLEKLMQLVSELVLTRNQLMQIMRTKSDLESEYSAPLQRLSLITSDLQEGIMETRMQPIGNAWNKLPRIIRDLSLELGKKIDLKMIGEDTELDRQLLELVKDPLTHMVRNSADHGIEMPDVRLAAGKPETGTVTLSAFHEGGHIIIEIKDDGKGLDAERIKQKILEKGLASEAEIANMDNRQIFQFIFAAGFSTAEKVTAVSGRGVGMDVVRTNIEKMGGSIDLDSEFGKGSTFRMKIPLTLAILPVLIMEAGGEKFALPQINVLELVRTAKDSEYKIEKVNEAPVLRLRGRLLPLINLSEVLGISKNRKLDERHYIVVCELGTLTFGLIVDRIFDTEEIVVKPVSKALKNITVYSGSTILGDGSVIMILDPNGLGKKVTSTTSKQKEAEKTKIISEEDVPVTFLLFKAGDGAPKAVPLELVSRLEKIKPTDIEPAGDLLVIQYRGDLMRITKLNDHYEFSKPKGDEATQEAIVFSDEGKILGLAVEQIIDIVDQPMKIQMNSEDPEYLGSMVIAGKTTDIIDIGHLFSSTFADWHTKPKEDDIIKTERVLLVEDSPFFRKLMVPLFMSRGYSIKTAANGLEAAHLLQEDKNFHLIITDIDMPEMNGLEFAESCKGDESLSHIPIIALTSNTSAETIAKGKEIGLVAHISKQDREGLFEAVKNVLENKTEAA